MQQNYDWAVVTGASAGIGEAFARRLAARGTRLILTARRQQRLEALAAELPTEVRAVPADLTLAADRDRLWGVVQDRGDGVELLVNNAGFGLWGVMGDLDRRRQLEMVQINVAALTDLAHRFVLLNRTGGRGRALINVASVVGLRPVPMHSVYAATKAYVVSLSLALAQEEHTAGLRVLALCPGPVPTEFQQVAGVKLDGASRAVSISAEQTATEGLEALARGETLWVPGAAMRNVSRALGLLPRGLATWLGKKAMEARS